MSKNGQILFFVLFLLFVVGFMGTGLAVVWQTDSQLRSMEKNGVVALYAAQAGLEHGKAYAGVYPTFSGWSKCSDDADDACWYLPAETGIQGARYKFNIYDSGGKKVWAKGQAYDGTVLAEKHLEQEVSGANWLER